MKYPLVGVIGSFLYSYIKGAPTFLDPTKWPVTSLLFSYPNWMWTIVLLLIMLALTLGAYLANRHEKQEEKKAASSKDEALVDVAKGVRIVLEELKIRPVVNTPITFSQGPTQPQTPQMPDKVWSDSIPRRTGFFTGRNSQLQQLHDKLLKQPQAISGLGGIGKTQIALEYAYLYREQYR